MHIALDNTKIGAVGEYIKEHNVADLKGTEQKKIFCGRKRFEVIDTDIKYEVVKELKSLKEYA